MTRIGFIGLGNMGGPMAANLARAGHGVRVFDLMPESVAKAIAAGCIAAGDAREAVADCEVVISMLPAGEHVRALWLAGNGGQDLLAALPAGALVVDCSTIDVASARQVGEAAKARGIRFVDAPVSGGVAGSLLISSAVQWRTGVNLAVVAAKRWRKPLVSKAIICRTSWMRRLG